jgi:hypothetical protein
MFPNGLNYAVTVMVALLYSGKLSKTALSMLLMVKHFKGDKERILNRCASRLAFFFQLLTFFGIYVIGSWIFSQLINISSLLEGWVILFLVQEIPAVLFEIACYIDEEIEEDIDFKLEFQVEHPVPTGRRILYLVFPIVMIIYVTV